MSYKLSDFGEMIANEVRIKPYIEALRRSVKPGSVVLEIGTGTGLMAMLACRFGARKVYAIEFDNVIEVARETAALNGLSDKIDFIQDLSTRVTLPEQADVIVSDLRGALPLYSTHIPSIIDARRFLAPGGVMIPSQDKIWAAIVSVPKLYDSIITPWKTENFGFDMRNIRERATSTLTKCSISPEQLVTEPQCWTVLDYSNVSNPNVSGTLDWTIAADREAHGFGAWFETTLIEGVGYSCAPGLPEVIYGNVLLPWSEPVPLKAGDNVCIAWRATLVGSDYVWAWETRVTAASREKAHFRQSTFQGGVLASNELRKRAADHRPTLTDEAEVDRFILTRMDSQTAVEQIARELNGRFPEKFKNQKEALDRVGDASVKFSR
jgi:type I protein arginine methyltransferase